MPEKDYSRRPVVDKLGIKPGHAIAMDGGMPAIDETLQRQILDATGRPPAAADELLDVALVSVNAESDAWPVLTEWKKRLQPAGGIWLLSPKRGFPGYIDQRELIAAGQRAGLVDNKVCSVSASTSAMRFVIRRRDRTG